MTELKIPEHGCSDRDCIMQPKTGQVTNGGCMCARQLQRDGYQNVLKLIWKLRQEIKNPKTLETSDMTGNEYQAKATVTAMYPNIGSNFTYPALGLAGESGEVCDKVKKVLRDDGGVFSPEKLAAIKLELGDVLWYVAALCNELGLQMEDVMQKNIDKLTDRAARGVRGGSGDYR